MQYLGYRDRADSFYDGNSYVLPRSRSMDDYDSGDYSMTGDLNTEEMIDRIMGLTDIVEIMSDNGKLNEMMEKARATGDYQTAYPILIRYLREYGDRKSVGELIDTMESMLNQYETHDYSFGRFMMPINVGLPSHGYGRRASRRRRSRRRVSRKGSRKRRMSKRRVRSG